MSSTNPDTVYCHNCGLQLPAGATFCPRCGTAVYVPPAGAQQPQQQAPPYYNRRAYKEWKRQQKQERMEKGGTGFTIGPIVGGAILIWLGISFYLEQIKYFASGNWWAFFIAGLGFIIMLQGVLLYSRLHRAVIGPFLAGGILVLIGVAFFYSSFGNLWPLLLVVIGIAIVASAFVARRRTPNPLLGESSS
jgi:uncharacterized Zn finger protein (UPF0148 family)